MLKKTLVCVAAVGAVAVLAASAATAVALTDNATSSRRVSAASTSAKPPVVSTTGFPSGPHTPGIFTERCGFSHEAADDPIMMAGQSGMAMHHDFYGNTGTNASSTSASLINGRTSCGTSADSSAYWIPVMYQNGKALTPKSALLYWRRPLRERLAIHSVPAGLQMVAGNAMATRPPGISIVSWTCTVPSGQGQSTDARSTVSPHTCTLGGRVKEIVAFPSCWDGHTLAAKSHDNVAYLGSGKQGCPTAYPVQIPQILFRVIYPTSSAANLRMSLTPTTTASTDSAHADFINAWRQPALDAVVAACVATSTRCGGVTGPGPTVHGPSPREQAKLNRNQGR